MMTRLLPGRVRKLLRLDEPAPAETAAKPASTYPALPRAIPPRSQPQPPPAPPVKPPARRRFAIPPQRLGWLVAGVLLILTLGFAAVALQPREPQLTEQQVTELVALAMASATPAPTNAARVFEMIKPSVVLIRTRNAGAADEAGEGIGTGVILDMGGSILTSLHVVESALTAGDGESDGEGNSPGGSEDTTANVIEIVFPDGTISPAEITARMPEKDIAVLKATQPSPLLIPATLGNPALLQPGDEAIVVGNPFGLRHTVTSGVISGLERSFRRPDSGEPLEGLIQFDAAANPGNSGGPLLNRDGEVVGIVTALANPTEQSVFIGIGFAVPIDVAADAAGPPPF